MSETILRAIIVSSWDDDSIDRAYRRADTTFSNPLSNLCPVTPGPGTLRSAWNGWRSFFVGPDGSNEGWEHAEQAEAARRAYVQWLSEATHLHLEWVVIEYGPDSTPTTIASSHDRRRPAEYRWLAVADSVLEQCPDLTIDDVHEIAGALVERVSTMRSALLERKRQARTPIRD